MDDLTQERLRKLREVAEKATQEHWCWINANHNDNPVKDKVRLGRVFGDGDLILEAAEFIYGRPEDGRFIVTFSPPTVLKLLELAERHLRYGHSGRKDFADD